jgi:hypothetical protein
MRSRAARATFWRRSYLTKTPRRQLQAQLEEMLGRASGLRQQTLAWPSAHFVEVAKQAGSAAGAWFGPVTHEVGPHHDPAEQVVEPQRFPRCRMAVCYVTGQKWIADIKAGPV